MTDITVATYPDGQPDLSEGPWKQPTEGQWQQAARECIEDALDAFIGKYHNITTIEAQLPVEEHHRRDLLLRLRAAVDEALEGTT